MRFEELFDNRIVFADKLKICMREAGYTKVSFAKKADISLQTLDCILNGELDNKNIFDKHILYSTNESDEYAMSDRGRRQHELLQDVLDICAIYY